LILAAEDFFAFMIRPFQKISLFALLAFGRCPGLTEAALSVCSVAEAGRLLQAGDAAAREGTRSPYGIFFVAKENIFPFFFLLFFFFLTFVTTEEQASVPPSVLCG